MKKILLICSVFLAMVSCQEDYELNADFTVPTELNSPASIQLDVSSSVPVVLSWSGGGAADGGHRPPAGNCENPALSPGPAAADAAGSISGAAGAGAYSLSAAFGCQPPGL